MFYVTYNIVSIFLLLPVVLYHLYQLVSGKRPPALAERFGQIPQEQLLKIGHRPVIWLHAVSVGEALAARPLLAAIRQRYPNHAILISNTTATGREVAERFAEQDVCICFPFDFLPAVRRTLDAIKPDIIIIMETEIWPNFTHEASRRNIPLILANGRISDRSYRRYVMFRWIFRNALQLFSALCMQTEIDRERVVAIGALPERTQTAGNIKHDIPFHQVAESEKIELRERYSIPANLTVITAGSTRPGEEEYVLKTYQELLTHHDDIFLVLVPRHPERSGEIADLLERFGLSCRRRTELASSPDGKFHCGEALLVDTVGEMMNLYALSDLVYVGGSLTPNGGHNLLEPASLGVPSIFGPHMNNFREIAALVLHYQAGIQVDSPEGLTNACRRLLDDAGQRYLLGENGLKMMRENGGATLRHMEVLGRYICQGQQRIPEAK